MNERNIGKIFPGLIESGYAITSPSTPNYNCLAWAAKETNAWWWPDPQYLYYWPPDVPRTETLEAFIKAYGKLGYAPCSDANYEGGFEKVAIYAGSNGKPTHAARQLGNGHWTSKLGTLEDIEHATLDSLFGTSYGNVVVILKRPKNNLP